MHDSQNSNLKASARKIVGGSAAEQREGEDEFFGSNYFTPFQFRCICLPINLNTSLILQKVNVLNFVDNIVANILYNSSNLKIFVTFVLVWYYMDYYYHKRFYIKE
jgi:hypothetical protein